MKLLVALAFLGAASAATADELYRFAPPDSGDGKFGDSIALYSESSPYCEKYHAQRAGYQYRKVVKGHPELDGKFLEGCYKIMDDMVYMIFEDGDQFQLPVKAFLSGKI